jgi:predicted transcriptional regulator
VSNILLKEGSIESLKELNGKLKSIFSSIYIEFEDHLDAINENTNEIQTNFEYLCKLDNKITKLNERIDEIHMILSKLTGKKTYRKSSLENIDPLTTKEKSVFLNLYTEQAPISYSDLAKKMKMPIPLVREYITNLLEKGIPVQKIYKNTRPYIYLDSKFRNLQAKKNILKIEQKVLV